MYTAEVPHPGDLLLPVLQRLAKGRQRGKRRVLQLPDLVEELVDPPRQAAAHDSAQKLPLNCNFLEL